MALRGRRAFVTGHNEYILPVLDKASPSAVQPPTQYTNAYSITGTTAAVLQVIAIVTGAVSFCFVFVVLTGDPITTALILH